jgi:hypothetical protein
VVSLESLSKTEQVDTLLMFIWGKYPFKRVLQSSNSSKKSNQNKNIPIFTGKISFCTPLFKKLDNHTPRIVTNEPCGTFKMVKIV